MNGKQNTFDPRASKRYSETSKKTLVNQNLYRKIIFYRVFSYGFMLLGVLFCFASLIIMALNSATFYSNGGPSFPDPNKMNLFHVGEGLFGFGLVFGLSGLTIFNTASIWRSVKNISQANYIYKIVLMTIAGTAILVMVIGVIIMFANFNTVVNTGQIGNQIIDVNKMIQYNNGLIILVAGFMLYFASYVANFFKWKNLQKANDIIRSKKIEKIQSKLEKFE